MKALALAAAFSILLSTAATAQGPESLKANGIKKLPAEASAPVDVEAIQKKIDEYTQAIKKSPTDDKLFGARGQEYKRIGQFDRAISDLNTAISINPSRQAYFEVRGNTFGKMRRFAEAKADYAKANSFGPPDFNLLLKLAQTACMTEDNKLAMSAANQALSIKPDDATALCVLGVAEQKTGLINDSIKHLSRVIELSPTNGEAFAARADSYMKLGKKALADTDLARARSLGTKP